MIVRIGICICPIRSNFRPFPQISFCPAPNSTRSACCSEARRAPGARAASQVRPSSRRYRGRRARPAPWTQAVTSQCRIPMVMRMVVGTKLDFPFVGLRRSTLEFQMIALLAKWAFPPTWRVLECGQRVWKRQNNPPRHLRYPKLLAAGAGLSSCSPPHVPL